MDRSACIRHLTDDQDAELDGQRASPSSISRAGGCIVTSRWQRHITACRSGMRTISAFSTISSLLSLSMVVQGSGGSSKGSPQFQGQFNILPSKSNSAGQSACDVANAVAQPCAASIGSQKPLPSSSCACNTVIYSLVYACGLCSDQQMYEITFGEFRGIVD
ncbi:hypothetical protein GY45DRAFT_1059129 [Cubamyces sp. BRFM 1775]|nr:hypothetical protein GY45DRAFT_1059129 [Cubamyces sp. BRFM 1775]